MGLLKLVKMTMMVRGTSLMCIDVDDWMTMERPHQACMWLFLQLNSTRGGLLYV